MARKLDKPVSTGMERRPSLHASARPLARLPLSALSSILLLAVFFQSLRSESGGSFPCNGSVLTAFGRKCY
ncbi:hypothetical protein HMPREF0762_01164 [Slackia exigua ATCC 700122]|uniref:Uncharacterized protein n=1 Tax=Slackia exigua (strain ATCC 700122 / DSM 15923 / CIP 105133 / JCM 11022 / KCTC 5966 / S-7) TaxID=649764 RepID=D0WHD2_SLAES|nr:hypothetical protein HMPREF0762_01164 [Slackia exigua ATCC 700122]